MTSLYLYIKNWIKAQEGQDLIEYALIIVLLVVVAVIGLGLLGRDQQPLGRDPDLARQPWRSEQPATAIGLTPGRAHGPPTGPTHVRREHLPGWGRADGHADTSPRRSVGRPGHD
jgi:Flp pilus assembly pilin Flp